MYIFPGLGLGTILSKARHVTDAMVEQASIALSASLTQEEKDADLVYPRLIRIRDISAQIALSVVRAAQKDVSDCIRTSNICAYRFCLGCGRECSFPKPFG
jgi:malate dehydrogenase (oxaloacetate-decarboxylating)(NADP+)